jgi:phosphoribosylglycinamide formyltransferase-1
MRAILAAIRDGVLNAEACLAISNNRDAPALRFAAEFGVPCRHISATSTGSLAAADREMTEALIAAGVTLVGLSGYMRKLGPDMLGSYRNRILNIHPSLLPKFGGVAMYGAHVHDAVLAAGETVSGATIHLVDGEYDQGPILAQRQVPVLQGDTTATLQARVAEIEPVLYLETLQLIATGALRLPD